MLHFNERDDSIEFHYPWFASIAAKLQFSEDGSGYTFTFNKNYLRLSKIVAEGWELIDVFRSILQLSLMERGMYMLHAAAVSLDDEGILLPTFGNTGKTTTAWMIARRGGFFVTDEFAILDSRGTCYGFPCSSLVSARLVKSASLRLTMKQGLSMRMRDLRSKILSTRFAPGGVKLYPDDNFETLEKTKITRLAFIQNGIDSLRQLNNEEAYTLMRAIQDYELNWRANPYIIARAFFRPSFKPNDISRGEEKIMRNLISAVKGSYLVSSSSGLHYESVEKIPRMSPIAVSSTI